jgi:hypothetical protein
MMFKSNIPIWKYVLLSAVAVMFIVSLTLYFIVVDNNGYKPYPKGCNSKEELVKYLKPDQQYVYWGYYESRFGLNASKQKDVLYSHGSIPGVQKIKDPGGTLFIGCLPAVCYKYIAYADSGEIKYITSNKALIRFVGQIDNLQEAILVAYAKGYYIDDSYGMGYRETAGVYEIMVKREIMCPRTMEMYLLTYSKKGIVKIVKKNVDNIGGCIMF